MKKEKEEKKKKFALIKNFCMGAKEKKKKPEFKLTGCHFHGWCSKRLSISKNKSIFGLKSCDFIFYVKNEKLHLINPTYILQPYNHYIFDLMVSSQIDQVVGIEIEDQNYK